MNYSTKPNQGRVFIKKIVDKDIRVIVVDVKKRTIREHKVKNSLTYIKKCYDFFEFVELQYSKHKLDCFLFGIDEDLKSNKPYYCKGYPDPIYGNGILLKFPYDGDYERLQSTKISLSSFEDKITFDS